MFFCSYEHDTDKYPRRQGKRADRVPTLSKTLCVQIKTTESEFCPPGAALLSEFQRMQAFNHKQQYPKVPFLPLLSLILLSAVKRADRVPALSINSLHTYNSDRIGILLSAVKRADRVPTLSIYQGCMPPCHIRQNRN